MTHRENLGMLLLSKSNPFVAHGTKERGKQNKRKAAHHIFFSVPFGILKSSRKLGAIWLSECQDVKAKWELRNHSIQPLCFTHKLKPREVRLFALRSHNKVVIELEFHLPVHKCKYTKFWTQVDLTWGLESST